MAMGFTKSSIPNRASSLFVSIFKLRQLVLTGCQKVEKLKFICFTGALKMCFGMCVWRTGVRLGDVCVSSVSPASVCVCIFSFTISRTALGHWLNYWLFQCVGSTNSAKNKNGPPSSDKNRDPRSPSLQGIIDGLLYRCSLTWMHTCIKKNQKHTHTHTTSLQTQTHAESIHPLGTHSYSTNPLVKPPVEGFLRSSEQPDSCCEALVHLPARWPLCNTSGVHRDHNKRTSGHMKPTDQVKLGQTRNPCLITPVESTSVMCPSSALISSHLTAKVQF